MTTLVTLAAVLGVGGLTACGGDDTATPTPAVGGDTALTALVAWSLTTLAATDTVSTTDATVGAALTSSGVSGVRVAAPSAGAGYVVTHGADAAPVALGATTSLVPVAVFAGPSPLTVSLVAGATAADARARLDDASASRTAAEQALTTNPAVTTTPAVTTVLRRGGLDLRAAALVTVLGMTGDVEIMSVTEVPAERAAGVAARTIVLAGVAPATVSAVAGGTVGAFHPTITAVTSADATQPATTTVQWPLTPFPAPAA